jgi:hypothetical protein
MEFLGLAQGSWVLVIYLPSSKSCPFVFPTKIPPFFQGLNFATPPELYHERVKDLGLEFRSHDKGSRRGIFFERMVSGRHDISYLDHLMNLCPQEGSEIKLGVQTISWKCKITKR